MVPFGLQAVADGDGEVVLDAEVEDDFLVEDETGRTEDVVFLLVVLVVFWAPGTDEPTTLNYRTGINSLVARFMRGGESANTVVATNPHKASTPNSCIVGM